MSLKILNYLTIILLFENIIVQTLIWGTIGSWLRGPENSFEWFVSLGSITVFLVMIYFYIKKTKAIKTNI